MMLLWAASAPGVGLDPAVQVALIGGIVTLVSLVVSTLFDRGTRGKPPLPPPPAAAVVVPPADSDDPDEALVLALVTRAELAEARAAACEHERERLRTIYGRLRDRVLRLGYDPDEPPSARPRPGPPGGTG